MGEKKRKERKEKNKRNINILVNQLIRVVLSRSALTNIWKAYCYLNFGLAEKDKQHNQETIITVKEKKKSS